MSLSITALSALLTQSSSPKELSRLLKLVDIEVLKQNSPESYQVKHENKELTAHSKKPLQLGSKYLINATRTQNSLHVKEFVKIPTLLAKLENVSQYFSGKDIQNLLQNQNAPKALHQNILELMSNSSNKEEFSAFSQLLLSISQNIVTIPFEYMNYYELFQMKKSYNNKKDKERVEFYATLHHLGVIKGELSLIDDEVYLRLEVAFSDTKEYLESKVSQLSILHVEITLSDVIEPFFEINENSILDVSI